MTTLQPPCSASPRLRRHCRYFGRHQHVLKKRWWSGPELRGDVAAAVHGEDTAPVADGVKQLVQSGSVGVPHLKEIVQLNVGHLKLGPVVRELPAWIVYLSGRINMLDQG